MRQRLSLAAALIGDPAVLVLDEATASLDHDGQAEVVTLLGSLLARGTTVLMSSHRAAEVRTLADRVVALNEGHVVVESRVGQDASEAASKGRSLRVVAGGRR
jgi:ABC-2 type transport system ATP-binding protein